MSCTSLIDCKQMFCLLREFRIFWAKAVFILYDVRIIIQRHFYIKPISIFLFAYFHKKVFQTNVLFLIEWSRPARSLFFLVQMMLGWGFPRAPQCSTTLDPGERETFNRLLWGWIFVLKEQQLRFSPPPPFGVPTSLVPKTMTLKNGYDGGEGRYSHFPQYFHVYI